MIRDVKSSDASDAYYCQVNVTTFNETVTKQAPLISVTVLGNAPYIAYMCIVYIKGIVRPGVVILISRVVLLLYVNIAQYKN